MAWRKVWDAGKARHTSPTPGAALLRRGLPESSQLASVTYRARPPHVVGPPRRYGALAARTKCPLHCGRELLVHLLEVLGRIGADTVTGLWDVGPKL